MAIAKNETIGNQTYVNLAPSNGANSPAEYRGSVAKLPVAEQATLRIGARGLKGNGTREGRVEFTMPIYDAEKQRRKGTVSAVISVRFNPSLTQDEINAAVEHLQLIMANDTVKATFKEGYAPK